MSATPSTHAAATPGDTAATGRASSGQRHEVRVLLYSDSYLTRDAVRAGVGRRPARDVEVVEWVECATGPAVLEAVDEGGLDLVILDGEAAKTGGMALSRQIKSEVPAPPPVLLLVGRPQDGWLASWAMADGVVPHPLDPVVLAEAVATMARDAAAGVAVVGHAPDPGRPGPDA